MIQIYVTGGTLDKIYDPIDEKLIFNETHLEKILQQARCTLPISLETLFLIDSLYMEDSHRRIIADKCISCLEDKILITHGTGTMVETAQYLAREVSGKTIVITGAMVPYSFMISDAVFNLGTALAFVQTLPNGIYLAMNGKVFSHSSVRKNKELGIFETT